MEDTKILLARFRERTLDILNCFKNEEFDKLNELFLAREEIIKIFKENPDVYTKEKIAEELRKTDIMELDVKIKELTTKNIKIIGGKLQNINNGKLIRKKYHNGFSGNSLFFNKKVY